MSRLQWEKIKVDAGDFESAAVFDVNPDAVRYLQSLDPKRRVAVVSIAGLYRTGKS